MKTMTKKMMKKKTSKAIIYINPEIQYLYDDDDDDDDEDDSDDEDDDNQYNMVRGISSNNGYNNYYDGDHNNSNTTTRQLRNPQNGKNRVHSNGRGGDNQQGVLGLIKKIYKEQDLSPPRVTVANPTTAATTTTADTNH
ncbi:unnamed protein product [[Candida] boidinii]|nr:unnamed protein product [[Candida] boidinii]